MEREQVESTNLASVGYDPNSETLEVEFLKSGDVYQYFNVPAFEYEQLLSANSIGGYFSANIRNGYAFDKL